MVDLSIREVEQFIYSDFCFSFNIFGSSTLKEMNSERRAGCYHAESVCCFSVLQTVSTVNSLREVTSPNPASLKKHPCSHQSTTFLTSPTHSTIHFKTVIMHNKSLCFRLSCDRFVQQKVTGIQPMYLLNICNSLSYRADQFTLVVLMSIYAHVQKDEVK